jgi:hypothetical protein
MINSLFTIRVPRRCGLALRHDLGEFPGNPTVNQLVGREIGAGTDPFHSVADDCPMLVERQARLLRQLLPIQLQAFQDVAALPLGLYY